MARSAPPQWDESGLLNMFFFSLTSVGIPLRAHALGEIFFRQGFICELRPMLVSFLVLLAAALQSVIADSDSCMPTSTSNPLKIFTRI